METTTKITTKEWPTSSQVQTTEYVEEQQALLVTFKPKMTKYRYDDVKPETWTELLKAESVGKFINSEIKPTHPFVKVD